MPATPQESSTTRSPKEELKKPVLVDSTEAQVHMCEGVRGLALPKPYLSRIQVLHAQPRGNPPKGLIRECIVWKGGFRLGEGKNGEVVGSSTRPPS